MQSMQACTFVEWIDTSPVPRPVSTYQVETKGQYNVRHNDAREAARLAREQQERRIRQQQIRLKGKEDELQRRSEELAAREAEIKRHEQEVETRQQRVKNQKKQDEGSSSGARKGKLPRYTQ